jgi:V/A-type H+-transporting ATPase subunit A
VELGPGLIANIYDGIQRPLPEDPLRMGDTITRGTQVPALDREEVGLHPVAKRATGRRRRRRARHRPGDPVILHKIMVPRMSGTVEKIESGEHTVAEPWPW